MNALDAGIVLLALVSAYAGWRVGFVARAATWVFMGIAVGIAVAVLPTVLGTIDAGSKSLLLLGSGLVALAALAGQAAGYAVGKKMKVGIPERLLTADKAAGVVAAELGVIFGMWLLLPMMADTPGWPARAARNSASIGLVDDYLPPPPDAVQTMQAIVGDRSPRVFEGSDPSPDIGPPPSDVALGADAQARAIEATVLVRGVACGNVQEGTGFVAAPNAIVTNAHVVAGNGRTEVIDAGGAPHEARLVVLDGARDLAILEVTGIDAPPLELREGRIGDEGLVFGHPAGGDLRAAPFRIDDVVHATGTDIYDEDRTGREVAVAAVVLAHGDSGAAFVAADGTVVAVAFAIAPDDPMTAYGLSTRELAAVLATPRGSPAAGPCID